MLIVFNEGKNFFVGVGAEKLAHHPGNQLISLPLGNVAAAIVGLKELVRSKTVFNNQ